MRTSRLELLHIALATATAGLPLVGRTQTLDTAKILTGFAAGGTVDTLARRVAAHMNDINAKAGVEVSCTSAGG